MKQACDYSADIKEEKEAAPHYREYAKKDPKNKIALNSMAVDETKHMNMLKQMVKEAGKKDNKGVYYSDGNKS